MPAKSRAQHGFMGLVLRYKKGDLKKDDIPAGVRNKVIRVAKNMPEEEAEKYTSTPAKRPPFHKGKRTYVRKAVRA